jgi:hypothetical protein
MRKPINLCGHDGCGDRAIFQATLVLRGSPIKGAATIRVCEYHRPAAESFVLNDENRTRLANHLVLEGFCDAFIAYGMVKHNAAVEFDRIAS